VLTKFQSLPTFLLINEGRRRTPCRVANPYCRTGSKFDNDSLGVIALSETDLKHPECHVAVAMKLLSGDEVCVRLVIVGKRR
jgi:hypothetical protein